MVSSAIYMTPPFQLRSSVSHTSHLIESLSRIASLILRILYSDPHTSHELLYVDVIRAVMRSPSVVLFENKELIARLYKVS